MRERLYKWLAHIITKHNGKVLLICGIVTIILFFAALRLGMKTSFVDMLPDNYAQVQEFNDIVRDYSSASSAIIVIESKEKNTALMKRCAEDIANRLDTLIFLKMKPKQKLSLKQRFSALGGHHPVEGVAYDTTFLVKRIDYKLDTDFYNKHGLITQKKKDLQNFTDMFSSIALPELLENINNNFEKEFVDDAENLSSIDGEQQAIQGLTSMNDFLHGIGDFLDNEDSAQVVESVKKFITGPEYMLLAMVPLGIGTCWMLGGMALLQMKFNYMNFMALPLILGIGIDDGVHILHRYHLEGRGSIPIVLRYTGRAILLTSLTTMIGFGSMGFASMRGTASMGIVLVLGVGACFLSSAFVLPALITIYEKVFSKK